MRERLIELLDMDFGYVDEMKAEDLADYLLANGVVVLPYKIGTSAYFISQYNFAVRACEIVGMHFDGEHFTVHVKTTDNCIFELLSDDIYFTKKEAEAARERSK